MDAINDTVSSGLGQVLLFLLAVNAGSAFIIQDLFTLGRAAKVASCCEGPR